MSHVVVATGFKREVATLRQTGIVVVAGGGDPAGLREKIERAAVGAVGIVSYGMSGALSSRLEIGDWVVGDRLSGAVELDCDPAWAAALVAKLPRPPAELVERLADALAGKGAENALEEFELALGRWIAARARSRTSSQAREAWLALWDRLRLILSETEALNLDRRLAVHAALSQIDALAAV